MKLTNRLLIIIILLSCKGIPIYSQVKLPSLFTDNMVLQQNTEVAIWGWTEPGKKVFVISSWDKREYSTKAGKEGKWKLKISTIEAGGPYDLTINDGTEITLKNVMLGEVWLCSGQSNMEMPMKGFRGQPVLNSNETILKSKNSNIRFISVPRASSTEPVNNFKGQWVEASPETVAEFSATAYYFGRLVNEILNVPVGLIDVTWGGSCIQAWMSKNTAIPFEEKNIPEKGDSISIPNHTPTALFNGMLYPVIGYGIKGCIWYQGESNQKEPEKYKKLFANMVDEWRTLWDVGEFPFYYVQIAPFNYAKSAYDYNDPKLNSAFLREAQLMAMDTIPNSGMVILLDAGDFNNIHPANKQIPGERLAYWALGKTYGIKGVGYKSPSYKAIEIKDTTIIVSFNQTNGITSYGKEVKNFEIAGEDKVFYPAKVKVRSKSVVIYSPHVKNPVAIRYGFKDYVEGDLFGTDGLPVSSFRTDNW